MSENDAAEPFNQRSDDELPSDSEQGGFLDRQSRRNFLRNAVIASAATAGVVGTASTVFASGLIPTPASLRPAVTKQLHPSRSQLSPLDPSSLCLEETALPGTSATCFGNGTNSGGEFWLFFTIRSAPVGDYTVGVTQSIDGGATQMDLTVASKPFKFANSKSVHVAVGGTPAQCPTSVPGSASASVDPVAVSVTGSTQDVQIAFHIVWNDTGSKTITFNATMRDSGNNLVAAPAPVSVVTPCPSN
jgi:hypothetical protein